MFISVTTQNLVSTFFSMAVHVYHIKNVLFLLRGIICIIMNPLLAGKVLYQGIHYSYSRETGMKDFNTS